MRPTDGQAGLTFTEILASVIVLGLVVVAGGETMSQAVRSQATLQDEPITAALLAGEIHELALDSRGPDPHGYREEFIELIDMAASMSRMANAHP